MSTEDPGRARALIERLARLSAAGAWEDGLNPTQAAALAYLARANRFSRAPSHVAAYLGATRGTTSQTLRALERKGLVSERRSDRDRRSISYAPTARGAGIAARRGALDAALEALPAPALAALTDGLDATLRAMLAARGGRAFGVCRTCRHHAPRGAGGYCRLLQVALLPEETGQICHEQRPRDAA
ncbi:MarR family transcriptional regulator [Rhodobacteraceae bacterium 2CG4]|uniref:MarR family transcriptional regulator n=1 Tax=Halovulum marinum TaxID=2662447 RepID=A0A6L5Z644_9RHOB|nr:MarR family transcriptional regulator [Halovulum marinum]MSU91515.1 MarR family transcriptional regulator [Halovulum marinum]